SLHLAAFPEIKAMRAFAPQVEPVDDKIRPSTALWHRDPADDDIVAAAVVLDTLRRFRKGDAPLLPLQHATVRVAADWNVARAGRLIPHDQLPAFRFEPLHPGRRKIDFLPAGANGIEIAAFRDEDIRRPLRR